MKSLYEISWKVPESEYRSDPAYSYSTLAKFNREGFAKLSSLFDKVSSPSLTFGSMVDTMLTDGEDAFNERFAVVDFPKLTDGLIAVVKRLYTDFPNAVSLDDIDDSDISRIAVECNYYAGKSYENTRIKNVRRDCPDYFNALVCSNGREVVSSQDYDDCVACVEALRTSPATEYYFRADGLDNIERQYQLKFKGMYNNIAIRCMMDLALVDHQNKLIIPCDLKTSSHMEYEFPLSFVQWCYYIQAQLYKEILRQNIIKDDYFKDFKIADYRFIVINRTSRNPLVWEYKDTSAIADVTYGKNGQYNCRNWRQILEELDYYLTNPREVPLGVDPVDMNNITDWLNKK